MSEPDNAWAHRLDYGGTIVQDQLWQQKEGEYSAFRSFGPKVNPPLPPEVLANLKVSQVMSAATPPATPPATPLPRR